MGLNLVIGLALANAAVIVWGTWMLRRSRRVSRFREDLLGTYRIRDSDARDRSAEFWAVDYDTMLWHFWKPLRSFYQGTEILRRYDCRYDRQEEDRIKDQA